MYPASNRPIIAASALNVKNGRRVGMAKKPSADQPEEDWSAFERAVDTVVKSGPQHRPSKKGAKRDPEPEIDIPLLSSVRRATPESFAGLPRKRLDLIPPYISLSPLRLEPPLPDIP